MRRFLSRRLARYDAGRNDPNAEAQSYLSPYLHFGQLSAQRVALEVQVRGEGSASQEAFLEELIIRRELSDNYCCYEPEYDNSAGFPAWAQRSLNEHRDDPREFLYTAKQFENVQTQRIAEPSCHFGFDPG